MQKVNSKLGHIGFLIKEENHQYYKDLLAFLSWECFMDEGWIKGYSQGEDLSIWFVNSQSDKIQHHDDRGLNHIAFEVDNQKDVDAVMNFLKEKGTEMLFDTPRHRPEFSMEGKTYYQIMFRTPDEILVEVIYKGNKED